MLGIVPGSRARDHMADGCGSGSVSSDDEYRGRKDRGLRKFSQSFKKRRDKTALDLIPVRYIRTTSVKPKTLNPVWNEKFRFDLEDVQHDRVHLDIWDHDDEFSVFDAAKTLNEVQGLKGLGRYFKQIAQSARTSSKDSVDDFLGSLNIRLDDIPSTGETAWYNLEGRSSRSNIEGSICLSLALATREDRGYSEEDNWNDIRQHEDLICVFIEYELRKFKYEVFRWTGELSKAATTVLHQHAIQGDITEVQQSVCRWMAYSRKHREHPFDWTLLLKLLEDLDEKWEQADLSRDEEEALGQSFQAFIEYGLGLIGRQREVYPPANKAAHVRLVFLLRCLIKLHGMAVFTRCCPFQPELHMEVARVLKKSTTDWYDRSRRRWRPTSDSDGPRQRDEDVLANLIRLVNMLNSDLYKGLQYYTPLYQKILQIDYFQIVYKQLDKLLTPDVKSDLREELGEDMTKKLEHVQFSVPEVDDIRAEHVCAEQMGMHLFELYLTLHEFCDLKEHLPASERDGLTITQYYRWYNVPIQRWINISKYKAIKRIKAAVELDKVGQVEGQVKQSTSAVDVACCFGQIIEFWRSMDWPDHIGAIPFVIQITKDLCEGAVYYADLIHAKLKASGYYDEVGQFDITEQLCITINDIEQVRRSLKPLPDALKFSDIIFAVEKTQGEKSSKAARLALMGTVSATDDEMIHKIKHVVDRVADKMRPDIKKDVFHLCWAPEKLPPDEAISDLLNYLDSNLLTLNTNLLSSNFKRILDSIWVEVLEEISEVLETEEVKLSWFFERLYSALEILMDFFHASGKGLSMSTMKNRLFEDLHWQLTLNKAHTSIVIEAFLTEKLHEQEFYNGTSFGSLTVRAYYNTDAEMLLVEVLHARNILALDPNGLSDPFVLIELCPHHVFPRQSVQQTQIVKNSLNPTFDESFEFSVSRRQCTRNGACISFTVMDHDFMLANDFAGEVFLSLGSIPGITGGDISGFTALKPLTLPLMQPRKGEKTKATAALTAMQIRDWDKDAQEFVKKRRQIEAQAQN
ncbi:hypothetical protein NP493_345g04038 [Ridgeia piscesae]|uniref:Uncharacterized protein n=1 Tax=Ridgeia piscesae TaxID=27915 RepID=A0AAD9L3K7_RIDPI|nr:hypothetical protein NP493_345g04038 [Ridgeia piscesae]